MNTDSEYTKQLGGHTLGSGAAASGLSASFHFNSRSLGLFMLPAPVIADQRHLFTTVLASPDRQPPQGR